MEYNEITSAVRERLPEYLEQLGIDPNKAFNCLHPSHEDKTPSAHVVPGGIICKCFGCGRTYDVFDIASYQQNLPLNGVGFVTETIPYLIETLGIDIDLSKIDLGNVSPAYRTARNIIKEIANHSRSSFLKKPNAKVNEEINKRGWSRDIVEAFSLGQTFPLKEIIPTLKEYGIYVKDIQDLGLANSKEESGFLKDKESLLIPLLNHTGLPIGFAVRNLSGEGPKYVNTPNSLIYNKSKYLYGIHLLKPGKTAYLVEGYTDVIRMVSSGMDNVLAYCSSSFTADQIANNLHKTNLKNLVFCLDSDSASINGILNSIKKNYDALLLYNLKIKLQPSGDPDSYIQENGIDKYLELPEISFFEAFVRIKLKMKEDPEEIAKEVIELLVKHGSDIAAEKRLQQVVRAFAGQFDAELLRREYQKLKNNKAHRIEDQVSFIKKDLSIRMKNADDPLDIVKIIQHASSKIDDIYNNDVKSIDLSPTSIIERLETMKDKEETKTGEVEAYRFNRFPELQAAIDGNWRESGFLTLGGSPNSGKCQKFDSEILLSDGRIATIEEVVRNKIPNGMMMTSDHKIVPCEFSDWIDSGVLKCYEVETRSGLITEPSETHPYYTLSGWKQVKDLKVGDKVAIAARYDNFVGQDSELSLDDATLLGLLLADGGLTQGFAFTKTDEGMVQLFKNLIYNKWPNSSIRQEKITYFVSDNTQYKNPALEWGRELGIMESARNKRIPNELRRSGIKKVANFLGAFYACDGWIIESIDHPEIGLSLCNKSLLLDVRHLLLRFGIKANIVSSYSTYTGSDKKFDKYTLTIQNSKDIIKFFNNIKLPMESKQEKLDSIAKVCAEKTKAGRDGYGNYFPKELWDTIQETAYNKFSWSLSELMRVATGEFYVLSKTKNLLGERYKLSAVTKADLQDNINPVLFKRIAYVLNDDFLISLAEGDIYFDEITNITDIGEHQCYDLTVPREHNFICNDTVVHNTTLFCNIAIDLIESNSNVSAVIHSIDDEAEIIFTRLVSILSSHKYGRIPMNAFRHPNYYLKEYPNLMAAREYGYNKLRSYILDGSLKVYDQRYGKNIKSIESLIRDHKQNSDKQPIFILDNFHKIADMGDRKDVENASSYLKDASQKYMTPILTTVEYKKFEHPREPNNNDIKESGKIEYDAKLCAHLHNDIHTFGDKSKMYIPYGTHATPIIKFIIGKNKLNSFKGSIYFEFDAECGVYKEIKRNDALKLAEYNIPYGQYLSQMEVLNSPDYQADEEEDNEYEQLVPEQVPF